MGSSSNPKANSGVLDKKATRKAALEALAIRIEDKSGAGKLKGKVGIVTGVGPPNGIGTATARLMAREGVKSLYLLDFDDTHLGQLVSTLKADFPNTKVSYVKADAANEEAISNIVNKALKEEGRLDFFFANAGISQLRAKDGSDDALQGLLGRMARTAKDIEAEEFSELMRINALSVFLAIKHAAPALAKVSPEHGKTTPGGSLVLTASIAGLKSNAGPLPYSASKAAVVSMAQTASYELIGQNVRVNAICPGLIQTNMTKGLFELAKLGGSEDKMGGINPMNRQGLPHEVASLALFLASDDSSYINGQALVVDGGLSSGIPYVPVRAKL